MKNDEWCRYREELHYESTELRGWESMLGLCVEIMYIGKCCISHLNGIFCTKNYWSSCCCDFYLLDVASL